MDCVNTLKARSFESKQTRARARLHSEGVCCSFYDKAGVGSISLTLWPSSLTLEGLRCVEITLHDWTCAVARRVLSVMPICMNSLDMK